MRDHAPSFGFGDERWQPFATISEGRDQTVRIEVSDAPFIGITVVDHEGNEAAISLNRDHTRALADVLGAAVEWTRP